MKETTLEALNSVGNSTISLQANSEIYPDELLRACTDVTSGLRVDDAGQISIAASATAWSTLRDFCRTLIETKNKSI